MCEKSNFNNEGLQETVTNTLHPPGLLRRRSFLKFMRALKKALSIKEDEPSGPTKYVTIKQNNKAPNGGREDNVLYRSLITEQPIDCVRDLLFQLCALGGRDECHIRLLVSLIEEAGPNIFNELGETPLAVALRRLPVDLNHRVFETLLQNGADAMMWFQREGYVLAEAILHFGDLQAVTMYLPYHNKVNAFVNRYNDTALHILVYRQFEALVYEMLSRGANPNAMNLDGVTPLHLAAERGSPQIMNHLILAGGILNSQCVYGYTPLHYACSKLDTGCIDLLLQYRCKVNLRDYKGRSPLYFLIMHPCNKVNVLIKLLDAGAKVTAALNNFRPIHRLAFERNLYVNAIDYAKVLVKREKLDINAMNAWTYTPLHMAAHYGTKKFIVYLLESGADYNILNRAGQTPLDLALYRKRFPQVIQIMKRVMVQSVRGQPITPQMQTRIKTSPHLLTLKEKLRSEIKMLSAKKAPVSYLDIYCANYGKLWNYVGNEEIVAHMMLLNSNAFKYYGMDILMKFASVFLRRRATSIGLNFLSEVFGERLPFVCVKKIVQCLSTHDLLIWKSCK